MEKKKKSMREEMQERLAAMTKNDVDSLSESIINRLLTLPVFKSSQSMMFFMSFRNEVRTESAIRHALNDGRAVSVPYLLPGEKRMIAARIRHVDTDLVPGIFGILQPRANCVEEVPPQQIDFVLVPGIVFDHCGGRIGLGGGYYDRFLEHIRPVVPRVAIAYSFQISDSCPMMGHDKSVNFIVTENEIIDTALYSGKS